MMWRIVVGALLSSVDAATDIYMVKKYFSEGLNQKADAMIVMIVTNLGMQLIIVICQYKKKSWQVKVKEVLICLLFLRPIVDAFRVSTNCKDSEAMFDPFVEMMMNKVRDCVRTFGAQTHSC